MSERRSIIFEVKWRIENVRSWFEARDDTLYSPQFLAEKLMNTRWKLKLIPNWQVAEKYISLAIQRDVDDNLQLIDLYYELSFLACDGSRLKSTTCSMKFAPKTVSLELSVKKDEILEVNKNVYLSKDTLIVCCRMWKTKVSIFVESRCSIQSIIGTKNITMQAKMDLSRRYQILTFVSTSSDISLISFAIDINPTLSFSNKVTFIKMRIESKSFRWHTCELFYFSESGEKISCTNSSDLDTLLISNTKCSFNSSNLSDFFADRGDSFLDFMLTLQLELKYSPAVLSEHIEHEFNNCETLSRGDQKLQNLNTLNPEKVFSDGSSGLQMSEYEGKYCSSEENSSNYEDEHLDTTRIGLELKTTLKQDLNYLHDDRLFCDTKLQTDTETFPAHRCVLSARSPVFKKMFTIDMKEKAGECINITDIGSDTMRRMLQFLYTDSTGELDMQSAKDLYIASDKYDIASLKERCSSFMKKHFCLSNICNILVLADIHQDKVLESAAQEYVLNYDEEIFGSEEWKLFMQSNIGLAARVMYLKCMKK